MKLKFILLIFTIGILSCSSEEKIAIANADLFGKWNWILTDGGLAAQIQETPTSTGNIVQFTLMSNYSYQIVKNGTGLSIGTYEVIMKKSIYSGEMERFIICTEFVNQQLSQVVINGIINVSQSNKLYISDNAHDGIKSSFEKIN